MSAKDQLFAGPKSHIVDFVFDQSVTDVFPDMIRRSVPGYETVISLLSVIAEKYFQSGSRVYDLGCSLGAATLAVHSRLGDDVEYIGVDSSASMTEKCRDNFQFRIPHARVQCITEDIRNIEIAGASVIILNFTLQFIPPHDRDRVVRNIYNGLMPGGVLIVSEKINIASQGERNRQMALYHQFKAANGYSELEISQKRSALENVMKLDTSAHHHERLKAQGFSEVYQWFQCFNFISLFAIK